MAAAALAVVTLAAGAAPAAAAGPGRPGTGQAGTAGIISTVAGGVGGPAPATKVVLAPDGVFYGGGSLYIAGLSSVRKVNPGTDHLTTPAGTGVTGPLGDGGPAKHASLSGAVGGAVDGAGNLVIADQGNNRVRMVTG